MQRIFVKYINKSAAAFSKKWLLTVIAAMFAWQLQAQNINTPNKPGPLGTTVNTYTGNLFLKRTDMTIPARTIDLDISFFYNGFLYNLDHGYGPGWSFQYNIRWRNDTVPGARYIFWGEGREDRYDSLSGGGYKAPSGFFTTLVQYQPGRYVLTTKDSMHYYFANSIHKRITRMEDANGNFINFNYNDSLLGSITNNAGQTVNFTYTAGHLATVTESLTAPARTFSYTYDGSGNLREVKDPLNNKTKYSYLVNGPMKTLSDRNNNTIDVIYYTNFSVSELIGCNKRQSFSYDTASGTTIVTDHMQDGNRVTKYSYQKRGRYAWLAGIEGNCCGSNMNYKYDEEGNVSEQKDANGNLYRFTYDAKGNILTVTDPVNAKHTYTYTAAYNRMATYTDTKGSRYNFAYDSKGNLTGMTTPGGRGFVITYNTFGQMLSSTDPKGNIYTYSYDGNGYLATINGPENFQVNVTNDGRGNPTSFTDARGNQISNEFDIHCRLKKITDPLSHAAQYSYDAEGNVVSISNMNGATFTAAYDASNRVVKVTEPNNKKITYSYNAADEVISMQDALSHGKTFSYDKRGKVSAVTDAEGNISNVSRDPAGNITGIAFPNGRSMSFTYDALHRMLSVSDGTGSIAAYTYDLMGNRVTFKNGTGATMTASYDSLNRIKQVTDPLGNSFTVTYDKNHKLTSVTDREGRVSSFTYDNRNRMATATDNNGFTITLGYDNFNNITSVKDQNNNTTTYTYDELNRRKRMTFADGTYLQYGYDGAGNMVSKRLTDGTTITYTYDSLSRVTARTLPGGETYSYGYDAAGRIVSASNNAGTVILTYDALNRLATETFDGRTTSYNYNIAGRTQRTVYSDNTVVLKEFDSRNRIIKISKDSAIVAEYTYNSSNQVIGKAYANGINTSMQYDFANRLNALSSGGGIIQNTQFTYDKRRNKTAVTRLNTPTLSEQFTYDNGYRLTGYKRGAAGSPVIQNTYSYDALGNRITANLSGTNVPYTTNNLNQLTGANGSIFTFDGRGNLSFDGQFYKTYDAENRLLKDSASASNVISYKYDAFNRRVIKNVNGNLLKYTYSGFAQIEERDASNNLVSRTVLKRFLSPVMIEKNGVKSFYHQNEMGSVEAMTTAAGRPLETYRYDAYGKPTIYDSLGNVVPASPSGNHFAFTGQEYDSATSSYRFFYRTYSPTTGTFGQRDPIEYGDKTGMYQYTGNNPANGVDVLGLKPCPEGTTLISAWDQLSDAKSWLELMSLGDLTFRFSPLMDFASPVVDLYKTSQSIESLSHSKTSDERISNGGDVVKNGLSSALGFGGLAEKGLSYGAAEAGAATAVTGETAVAGTVGAVAEGGASAGAAEMMGPIGLMFFGADKLSQQSYGDMFDADAQINDRISANETKEAYLSRAHSIEERVQLMIKFDQTMARKWEAQRRWREGKDCPPPGGTRQPPPPPAGPNGSTTLIVPLDPNLIIGPDGEPSKKWVSVKDRLPYTVLFENDSTATAPAKFIRITSPIEPKENPATFELGSFGFNSQVFDVPVGTASYYQRLDCRDSLGLYVDVTAGYDQISNRAFWEFQSIDPITLLPTEEPLAGLLLLQDTANKDNGNGFVNFSIKPVTSAVTLDTIGARATIVFDSNDAIPTNIHSNTIDAFAPTSNMTSLPSTSNNPVALSWNGVDDVNGCGVRYYTLYVSTDGTNFSVLKANITRTDTTFVGAIGTSYSFFVLATDSVGNTEILGPGKIKTTFIGGVVPVTGLALSGKNIDKDNMLDWSTIAEVNSREFSVERSFNGTSFTAIHTVNAAGNSNTRRDYQYRDRNIDLLKQPHFYYRIKQIDINGNATYSNIVRLTYNQKETVHSIVYPNPTQSLVTVTIGDLKLIGTQAMLYDESGRLLQRVKITAQSQAIDLGDYSAGIYIIRLSNKEVMRVVKK